VRASRSIARPLILLFLLALTACGASDAVPPARQADDIAALTRAFTDLGPEVDPEEAARAARIAYEHTGELAIAYQITDPPLIHNTKVNMGLRPRGLCWHWAEDMEKRLNAESFRTLEVHRAIANADNPFRIDHSTAILARKGDTMFQGVVLDPWRYGGVLHWSPVLEDTRYKWQPQLQVHETKRRRRASR
jgi:hypothetical protein